MYKVKDAADALGVTRVEIFEILLSQRERFATYVKKENSITYISEEGLSLLKSILNTAVVPEPAGKEAVSLEIVVETAELVLNQGEDVYNESVTDEGQTSTADFNAYTAATDEFESEDDLVSLWLREIQEEDIDAQRYDQRLKELRTLVTQQRNKILTLDSEIKRKDEAIKHYHEIMKDDIRWLEDLERKARLVVKHEFSDLHEETIEEPDEDKNNFFKFFKR